jgi:peptidyl-dipeptidase Dcp
MKYFSLDDITIRTSLQSGDIGYITFMHGNLYRKEYNYGISFEAYVARGLAEFYEHYNVETNRVWVCEHGKRIIGFMALMKRGDEAQLRYFIIEPEYRGLGLGKNLMALFIKFLYSANYKKSYLLTTDELHAAAHLYTSFGFKLVEQKESTFFGTPVIENRYEWNAE